ncbi:MAG: DNA polymerase III subunit delta [Microbacteriaceae bacterium]
MNAAKVSDWRKVNPTPLMLAFGPESYVSEQALKSVKEALRQKYPELEVSEIEAADYSSGQLLNLASPSLFAEPRLIVIQNLEKCTDALIEDGKSYAKAPAADTYVFFQHSAATVRGKALLEAIRSAAHSTEIDCAKVDKEPQRIKFVQGFFAHEARKITDQAVRSLVDAFSGELAELASACHQLLMDSAEAITEELVDRYFGGRVQTTSFKIADIAINGRPGEAVAMLRHGFNTGLDPVPVVYTLANRLRQMARVHSDPKITPTTLGIDSWRLNRIKGEVQGWSDENLGAALRLAAQADAAAKGAERDPQYRVEQLVIFMANKGKI